MNAFLYTLLFYLASPLIWCYLLFRAIRAPEYRDGFLQRLGLLSHSYQSGGIQIHCASVGETRAAAPLVNRLLTSYPGKVITITTTTPTGKKTVMELFGEDVQHAYLPLDWPGSCARFLKRLKPELVILMETELWLNFLKACNHLNLPVLLANARLSKKSLKKYQKHPKLAKTLFTQVSKIGAQYESDKANYLALGTDPEMVEVVGNIKFDLSVSQALGDQQQRLRQSWAPDRVVWIAISIHPGEFDAVLAAHQRLLSQFPEMLLVAIPRHPEKFQELKDKCQQYQLSFVSRSEGSAPTSETRVVIGDTMGEILLMCGSADIAYVGGSLIERGGHNPLEPLACGLPVLMGPHYYNFLDIANSLRTRNLLDIVEDEDSLVDSIADLVSDTERRNNRSRSAAIFMQENRGSVDKLVAMTLKLGELQQLNDQTQSVAD